MNNNIVFTLADHIHFAIIRYQRKMYMKMPIMYDIKYLYPKEMQVGENALRYINKCKKIKLSKEEGASIALHFINAESISRKTKDTSGELIEDIITIIEDFYSIKIDRNGFNYSRFVSHMHWVLISTLIVVISSAGTENVVSAAVVAASFSVGCMCLGAALLQKNASDKSASISYVIAQTIGGVTEPGLYGIGFRYKRPFIGMAIGGFAGALYGAVVGLTAYSIVPVASFLCILGYTGGSTMNFINAIISALIAFVVAAIATYVIGLEKR